MRSDELVERLLAQNDKLIAALTASSPVEVIRALNPPLPAPTISTVDGEWADDPAPRSLDDPWGDDAVPLEVLRGPIESWRPGWVEPPRQVEDPPVTGWPREDGSWPEVDGPAPVEELGDAASG